MDNFDAKQVKQPEIKQIDSSELAGRLPQGLVVVRMSNAHGVLTGDLVVIREVQEDRIRVIAHDGVGQTNYEDHPYRAACTSKDRDNTSTYLKTGDSQGLQLIPLSDFVASLQRETDPSLQMMLMSQLRMWVPTMLSLAYKSYDRGARKPQTLNQIDFKSLFGTGMPGPIESKLRDALGEGTGPQELRLRFSDPLIRKEFREKFPILYQLLEVLKSNDGYYDLTPIFTDK